jgi:hypothetical protein
MSKKQIAVVSEVSIPIWREKGKWKVKAECVVANRIENLILTFSNLAEAQSISPGYEFEVVDDTGMRIYTVHEARHEIIRLNFLMSQVEALGVSAETLKDVRQTIDNEISFFEELLPERPCKV